MRKMPTTKQIDELQKMIDNGGSGGNSSIYVVEVNRNLTFDVDPDELWAKLSDSGTFVVAINKDDPNFVYIQREKKLPQLTEPYYNLIHYSFTKTNSDNFYHLDQDILSYKQNANKFEGHTYGRNYAIFVPPQPDTTNNYELTCKAGDIAWTADTIGAQLYRHTLLVQATDVIDSNEVLSGKYVITMIMDLYSESDTAITTATFYTKMPKSVLIPAVIKVFKDTRVNPGDAISYTDTVETGAFALAIHESPAKYVIDAGPGYITCIFPEFEFTTIQVLDDSVSAIN